MRKNTRFLIATAVVMTVGIGMTGCFGPETSDIHTDIDSYMMLNYTDNDGNEVIAQSTDGNDLAAVICDNEYINKYAFTKDGETYFDISGVKTYIDDRFYYDSTENLLMYTDATTIYKSTVGDSSIGGEDLDYTISVMDGETCYVNLKFVKKYIDFDYKYCEGKDDLPDRLVINTADRTVDNYTVKKDTQIRVEADYMADIVSDVDKDVKLCVLDKSGDWSKIITEDGIMGYILNKKISSKDSKEITYTNDYDTYTHTTMDEKISLVWHQVTNTTGNTYLDDMTSSMKGVNVISPTWFSLDGKKGNISSIASSSYVTKAHSKGLKVWALINDFSSDNDGNLYVKKVVNNTTARQNLVSNIMDAVTTYNLDGINIDFEYINVSEGAGYLQFLRELSIECRKEQVILSIDNYQPAAWTEFYDRNQQGRLADYIIVMNYDEHTTSSDEAGSVSSMTFTRNGLQNTIDQVGDASRVINGMPFYTRIWTETPEEDSDGSGKLIEDSANGNFYLSTRAVSMDTAKEEYTAAGATPTWNEDAGQNYVYYENGNSSTMIWLEDATSVENRLKLIDEYEIAGAGYWKLGLESEDIWDAIGAYFGN